MSEKNVSRVTVLGLGAMGTALAEAFLAGGHATTVWNRTPGKDEALVAKGALRAETVAEAIAASPLVVVCLLDDASVREVLEPVADALSGRAVVNLTNGTPAQARAMAVWAAEQGVDYVDGGIMAIPPGIGTPHAFLLYSGSSVTFEAHREVLELLGAAHFLGDDAGLAALYDLALLSGMYGLFAGVWQAVALVRSENVRATEFMAFLKPWLSAMFEGNLDRLATQVDSGDYMTGVVSNLAMQAAAFPNFITVAEEQGVRPDLMLPIKDLLDRAVAEGHGAGDATVAIELLKN
ncbi:3-hydroxyisobutyrate dehydrogenase [Streptoalloteichus tenebrarius]|uniref:3-hydroxyisobutyrate dehydrogenase n=1 Tax=Streptoalloteichus tenebrarius (strain ATCC 17920 / DSM 40477 / JCM 4838 / CBS 697.72 / NBRC 16177 / NCIMB 11028 / NRRL B-12390 / A12253. 1 / ISP 5477) TaxID=1933 RepID=A0ABT1HWS5_STRSD|nr:NAD(P)-binding domain-containing protein [Streptoalloteichus tenebrarius]MCP2259982.1 3-hydroxyisobutyrate dehydrogenase [Streptoalloteichus tenebrarius]